MKIAQLLPVSENTNGVIRVLVADHSRMHCDLLVSVLKRQRNLSVRGCSGTSEHVLKVISETRPDVTVTSANLDDGRGTGLQLIQRARAQGCPTRSIVLLDRSERDSIVAAFRAGARGVFSHSESPEILPKCILSVYHGQIWANSRELDFILEALATTRPLRIVDAKGMRLLTERESQVVSMLSEGMTNREIARRLGLSENTVRNYFFHIYEKLGVSNRVELVLYALVHRGLAVALILLLETDLLQSLWAMLDSIPA